jgi:dephospho-CoA kinase
VVKFKKPHGDFMRKIIGLTGGIGSGKSTVAGFIEKMNFPVYYSDVRAKEIVNEDGDLRQKIIKLLGDETYKDGFYNRKYVSKNIFRSGELLKKLNGLIHPVVKIDFENWMKKQNTEFIFKETALLFELGLNRECYKSVLITADDEIRIERVMERDGKTREEIISVISKQIPEKDKIKLADFVIFNNGNLQELEMETKIVLGFFF